MLHKQEDASTGHLVRFRPRDWLDRVFEISVVLKGIDGLLEVVGGVLLLLAGRAWAGRPQSFRSRAPDRCPTWMTMSLPRRSS
jgi:hypothetical protein